MIYLCFILWFILMVLTGCGLYRLWTRYLGGALVDWLMLPATLISELAYSCGRLLTGRPAYGGLISPRSAKDDACRHAISGKNGFWVASLASLLVLLAIGGATVGVTAWLGKDVIYDMATEDLMTRWDVADLPRSLPESVSEFWDIVGYQAELVRRLCEAWLEQHWREWQTWVFAYFAIVFAVRFGPVRHDQRAAIFVAAGVAGLLSLLAATIESFNKILFDEGWMLLTFLWTTLLLMLSITLIIMGIITIFRIFVPRGKTASGGE